jgi:hypothetical protein
MKFDNGISVTVYRVQYDRYGGAIAAPSTHTIDGCGITATSSSETLFKHDTVTATRHLLAPPGADLLATDEVGLPDGTRWQVDGDVRAPRSPFTGWTPGTVVPLSRSTG